MATVEPVDLEVVIRRWAEMMSMRQDQGTVKNPLRKALRVITIQTGKKSTTFGNHREGPRNFSECRKAQPNPKGRHGFPFPDNSSPTQKPKPKTQGIIHFERRE